MTDASVPVAGPEAIEGVMRAELAHCDAMASTIIPILRHLVTNDDSSVFSEEIVARTRAMIEDLAQQLMATRAEAGGEGESRDIARDSLAGLVDLIAADGFVLAHVHGLAIEWQLTEKLQARMGIDPLLSPLLQALIASNDPPVAAAAMNLLAAQARFAQSQRRMQLPLGELPADILHAALVAFRQHCGADDAAMTKAEQAICQKFDESQSRLGLMARLIMGMGGGARVALSIEHAGLALFLTALSLASGQDRSQVSLSTNEGQLARMALALAAAGLKPDDIEGQFGTLHPDVSLPAGFDAISPDRAAALLAHGGGYPG